MAADPNHPASPKRAPVAEKRRRAFELRKAGASYRAIARALGCSPSRAHDYVNHLLLEMAQATAEDAELVLAMELARLDDIWRAAYELVTEREHDGQGRVLGYAHGHELRLKAMDRLNRTAQRRAALLGLDAPQRMEFAGQMTGAVNVRTDLSRMSEDELREEARRHGIPFLEPEAPRPEVPTTP